MNRSTNRVECAYCQAVPLEDQAFLLAEKRAWRLWLCARCLDVSEGLWLTRSEPLPPVISDRLERDRHV